MKNIISLVLSDFKNNVFKIFFMLFMYRILFYLYSKMNRMCFYILCTPIIILYKIYTEFLLNCEISFKTKIGENIIIHHGQSLIINKNTIIGDNVVLRHCTTVGNKSENSLESPTIGNNVEIGSNCVILGNISIEDNVVIGAGAVVVKNIQKNSIVAGNPAVFIKKRI
ncbi:MAG: hypothetical protein PHN18_12145 [Sulfurospirillaceae bacterium]|nr:hypothetical protein [Sulfurospirillaceae bacterium]MDD2826356.1 hypothetical protein [Sulfurospirillaceae bacterium]